ncbi:MAG TPA: hypothetical protein VNH11_01510 [Pirellulales bacterium]|nr:hypothetical protein [Pirellulales bacterium]
MIDNDACDYNDLDPSVGEGVRGEMTGRKHALDLHRWFARRPLTLTRVAAYLALTGGVDSGSDIVKALAAPTPDAATLRAARERIREALGVACSDDDAAHDCDDFRANVLDPFAGGGSVPLEALRLGCSATAGELNPLAAAILRATLSFPVRLAPKQSAERRPSGEHRWEGLLPEFERWFTELQTDVANRWSKLYAREDATVYRLWVRRAKCPNEQCGCNVPLRLQVDLDACKLAAVFHCADGQTAFALTEVSEGAAEGRGSVCPFCGTAMSTHELRSQNGLTAPPILAAVARRSDARLSWSTATSEESWDLASGQRDRLAELMRGIAGRALEHPVRRGSVSALNEPEATTFADLFSPRQLLANLELSDAIATIKARMAREGLAKEHVGALTTYFAFSLGYVAQRNCVLTSWNSQRQTPIDALANMGFRFRREFIEAAPMPLLERWFQVTRQSLEELTCLPLAATVLETNAETLPLSDNTFDAVVTDPPYFDNIPYFQLSCFYWAWESRFASGRAEHAFVQPDRDLDELVVVDKDAFVERYETGLGNCFAQCFRVLKPGRLLCLILTSTSRPHFHSFVGLSEAAGFEIVSVKRVPLDGAQAGTFLVYLRKPSSPSEHLGLATDADVALERLDSGEAVNYEALAQLLSEQLEPDDVEEILPRGSKGPQIERLQEALAVNDPRELLERNLGRQTLRRIAREKGLLAADAKQSNPVDALLLHFGFRVPSPGARDGVRQAIDRIRHNASRLRQSREIHEINGLASEATNMVEAMIKRGVYAWARIAFGQGADESLKRLLATRGKPSADLRRLSFGDYLTLFEELPDCICQSAFANRVKQKFGRAHIYLPKKPKNNSLSDRIRKVVSVRNKVAHATADLSDMRDELVTTLEMAALLLDELATEHAIPRVGVASKEIHDMWGRTVYEIRLDNGAAFEAVFSSKLQLGQSYFFFGSVANPIPVDPILISIEDVGDIP